MMKLLLLMIALPCIASESPKRPKRPIPQCSKCQKIEQRRNSTGLLPEKPLIRTAIENNHKKNLQVKMEGKYTLQPRKLS